MSENKAPSFMQELDRWTGATIIDPLLDPAFEDFDGETLKRRVAQIYEAVRQKVLESYRNGQKAGTQPGAQPRKEPRR